MKTKRALVLVSGDEQSLAAGAQAVFETLQPLAQQICDFFGQVPTWLKANSNVRSRM